MQSHLILFISFLRHFFIITSMFDALSEKYKQISNNFRDAESKFATSKTTWSEALKEMKQCQTVLNTTESQMKTMVIPFFLFRST